MGRLLYHNLSGTSGLVSPFDEAILEVAKSGYIDIVSPYIGVDYLDRIVQVSDGWRLISDVEAWLSSLSIRARPKAWLFIRDNLEKIHHCPAIHAKAVISKNLAMFGSANLTNTGILGRTELGILIDDIKVVNELGDWFNQLWQQTRPPIADETSEFIQWLDAEAESERVYARKAKFTLSSSSKKIYARLISLNQKPKAAPEESPLNLDALAQTILIDTQHHFSNLEKCVEEAINTLVTHQPFTFAQVVREVSQSFAAATRREIFFALLAHCANHVRSTFAEDTRNRLILNKGVFSQSNKVLLHDALTPFDTFLVYLINQLDFENDSDLPVESSIQANVGLHGGQQIILISSLLDSGFLELEDRAGELPLYRLAADFKWEGRYILFTTAMRRWELKKSSQVTRGKIKLKVTEVANKNAFSDQNKISNQLLQTAHEALQIKRRAKIDRVFAFISTLIHGQTENKIWITKTVLFQIEQAINVDVAFIESILAGFSLGVSPPKILMKIQKNKKGILVSLNTKIMPDDLADYPETQKILQSHIKNNPL